MNIAIVGTGISGLAAAHFLYPHHDILAEESGGKERHSDYCWIIDPIDGTTNFTHGLPIFCVSIGLEHKGEIVAGVIYDPNLDELFTAEKGKGAYRDGEKIFNDSIRTDLIAADISLLRGIFGPDNLLIFNALSAGLVMGLMIMPMVSTLS